MATASRPMATASTTVPIGNASFSSFTTNAAVQTFGLTTEQLFNEFTNLHSKVVGCAYTPDDILKIIDAATKFGIPTFKTPHDPNIDNTYVTFFSTTIPMIDINLQKDPCRFLKAMTGFGVKFEIFDRFMKFDSLPKIKNFISYNGDQATTALEKLATMNITFITLDQGFAEVLLSYCLVNHASPISVIDGVPDLTFKNPNPVPITLISDCIDYLKTPSFDVKDIIEMIRTFEKSIFKPSSSNSDYAVAAPYDRIVSWYKLVDTDKSSVAFFSTPNQTINTIPTNVTAFVNAVNTTFQNSGKQASLYKTMSNLKDKGLVSTTAILPANLATLKAAVESAYIP
jgi:hypothetical protein